MTTTASLDLKAIRIDGGTQSRAAINPAAISEYAEAMRDGAHFPPPVVFHDGADHWLADGFHRFHALMMNGSDAAEFEVRQGNRRDAILYSAGANASHGLRRNRDDKRRAVSTLLADEEWSKWSDREIARRCGVGADLVGTVRTSILSENDSMNRTFVHHKTGRPATMQTANIGGSGKPDQSSESNAAKVDGAAKSSPAAPAATAEPEPDFDPLAVRTITPATPDYNGLTPDLRIIELMDHVTALEGDIRGYVAELKTYRNIKVMLDRGGPLEVIAGKDEVIRGLETRLYSESAGKAEWMRKAKYWEKKARELGWRDTRQDGAPSDVPADYDEAFLAAVNGAEGGGH